MTEIKLQEYKIAKDNKTDNSINIKYNNFLFYLIKFSLPILR